MTACLRASRPRKVEVVDVVMAAHDAFGERRAGVRGRILSPVLASPQR
jgi:hypothetical protein